VAERHRIADKQVRSSLPRPQDILNRLVEKLAIDRFLKNGKGSVFSLSLVLVAVQEGGHGREWGKHKDFVSGGLDLLHKETEGQKMSTNDLLMAAGALAVSVEQSGHGGDRAALLKILNRLEGAADLDALEHTGWLGYLAGKCLASRIPLPAKAMAVLDKISKGTPVKAEDCAAILLSSRSSLRITAKLTDQWIQGLKSPSDSFLLFASLAAQRAPAADQTRFIGERGKILYKGLEVKGDNRWMWKGDTLDASVRTTAMRLLALMAGYLMQQGTVK